MFLEHYFAVLQFFFMFWWSERWRISFKRNASATQLFVCIDIHRWNFPYKHKLIYDLIFRWSCPTNHLLFSIHRYLFQTESNEMETIFFLLLISTMWNLVLSNTKCHCNKSTCVTPVNCTHGLVWDHCYCCRTCAKSEGEVCGGKNYEYGECGRWQECVVRRRRNFLNRFKKHNEMIGRCEPCELNFHF